MTEANNDKRLPAAWEDPEVELEEVLSYWIWPLARADCGIEDHNVPALLVEDAGVELFISVTGCIHVGVRLYFGRD